MTFAREVVFGDGGLTTMLTAPYTFANDRVRQIYGFPSLGIAQGDPDPFVRLDLDPTQRAGLLTQAGFLAANSEGRTPNIIIRGVHIAQRVLCVALPSPPDAVPPLPVLAPDSTNRERVQMLTGEQPCASCHATLINPLGFAFEALDGFGEYRTEENGKPVDSSGTYMLDGAPLAFNGAVELVTAFAQSRQAHECYARRWAEYMYGKDLSPGDLSDANLIAQGGALSLGESTIKNLIINLVATDAFLSRLP